MKKQIPVKYASLNYFISENIFPRNALKIDSRKLILFRQRFHSFIHLFQCNLQTALTSNFENKEMEAKNVRNMQTLSLYFA